MPAGIIDRVGPYIIPSAAAPGSITINSVSISDAAITENESTTITVSTDVNADYITVEINEEWFAIEMDNETGAVRTWIRTIKGSDIGTCTNEAVTTYAGASGSNTTSDNGTTITVTAGTAMYAPMLMDIMNWIQDELQGSSVDTYAYLGALDDNRILLGYRPGLEQQKNDEAIYIDPMEDDIEVVELEPTEQSTIKIAVTVVNKKLTSVEGLLEDNINLSGDVYDFLQKSTNRDMGGECTFATVTHGDFGFAESGSQLIRWTQLTITILHKHSVA